MTRVSSFGHQQIMLSSLLTNQSRMFDDQKQITTGKKIDSYSGFARETSTLLSAKSVFSQTKGFTSASEFVDRNLRTNDVQLTAITDGVETIRDTVLGAIAQNSTLALMEILGETYGTVVSALNTNIGGVHIFGGARTDVEPVVGKDIADLIAAATPADLFQNDQRRPSAKVGQNTIMEYGLLADEIGLDIFAAFKNIADFDAGPFGPILGELTPAQRTFLDGELATLDTAVDKLRVLVARNGTRQKTIETFISQHADQEAFLEVFISDIEDVDIAEAIMRLNNDQVALEASYKISGELSRLSLLNFI